MDDPHNDALWIAHVIFMTQMFGAWYLVYQAFHTMMSPGVTLKERKRCEQFVYEACWAVDRLDPPFVYDELYHNLYVTFARVCMWSGGSPESVSADLMEDLQIVGVNLKKQLRLLGLDDHTYI